MTDAAAPLRRYDLDWVRIGAFALLILYHVGMFYVPWDFHVKSPHPVRALEPLMLLTHPWRLTLLFLVSGAATRFMADSRAVGRFTRERMARLLPPLVFGMLVVVPPQTYYQLVEKLAYAGGPLDFYRRYLTASGHWRIAGAPLVTPTWNHLWFVAYLVAYTLLLAGGLALAGRAIRALGPKLAAVLRGPWLLILPILWYGLARTLLGRFGETHDLVMDPYVHAMSLPAFLFGFLAAKEAPVWAAMERSRWIALVVAAAGWAAFASYVWVYEVAAVDPAPALRIAMRWAYAANQWAAIVAVLGFASRGLRGYDHPVRRYLTEAIFPFYIVHQTVIVVAGHYLARAGLPQGLEAAALVAITTAGCFGTYELVRRIVWLRPLFGLKVVRKEPPARRETSPRRTQEASPGLRLRPPRRLQRSSP